MNKHTLYALGVLLCASATTQPMSLLERTTYPFAHPIESWRKSLNFCNGLHHKQPVLASIAHAMLTGTAIALSLIVTTKALHYIKEKWTMKNVSFESDPTTEKMQEIRNILAVINNNEIKHTNAICLILNDIKNSITASTNNNKDSNNASNSGQTDNTIGENPLDKENNNNSQGGTVDAQKTINTEDY